MEPNTLQGNGTLFKRCVYEFIGTCFLTAAYCFGYTERAFLYFLSWLIAVNISGAHFNPATTLGVWFFNRCYGRDAKTLLAYIAA